MSNLLNNKIINIDDSSAELCGQRLPVCLKATDYHKLGSMDKM